MPSEKALQYSAGVVKGCYHTIEKVSGSEYHATVITPYGKKTTTAKDPEAAKQWVEKEIRWYLRLFSGAMYDN